MSRFFSAKLASLKPYVPGEQPQDMQYVKLNTNESPFPPSPKAVAVLEGGEASKLNLYSDPTVKPLTEAIAEFYGIGADCVFAGNGSDEVLAFAFDSFAGDKKAYFPDITYGFYPVFADFFGILYETVALDENLGINIADYADKDGVIVLANPNAQTGRYLELSEIESLVAKKTDRLVIVDEAYIDFGGESAVALTKKYDNILVVQTFSKSRSLAGARVGFAIGNSALIADLNTAKYSFHPYNINRLSMMAAVEAVKDVEYFDNCRKTVIANREWTAAQLSALGFTFPESRANFILASHPKISGEVLYQTLKSKGVLVRHFKDARIQNSVRITIGSKEQMQVLIEKIKEILEEMA